MVVGLAFLWESEQWQQVCVWVFCLLWDSYWVALSSLYMRDFTFLTVSSFVLFGCPLLEPLSFLKRNQRWDGCGAGDRGIWEEGREGKLWLESIVWEKNLFSFFFFKKKRKLLKRKSHNNWHLWLVPNTKRKTLWRVNTWIGWVLYTLVLPCGFIHNTCVVRGSSTGSYFYWTLASRLLVGSAGGIHQ